MPLTSLTPRRAVVPALITNSISLFGYYAFKMEGELKTRGDSLHLLVLVQYSFSGSAATDSQRATDRKPS